MERIGEYSSKGIACWSGNDDECHDSRHYHGGVVRNVVEDMTHGNDDESPIHHPFLDTCFFSPTPVPTSSSAGRDFSGVKHCSRHLGEDDEGGM